MRPAAFRADEWLLLNAFLLLAPPFTLPIVGESSVTTLAWYAQAFVRHRCVRMDRSAASYAR